MENKSFDKKFNKRILTILIGIVLVIMLIAGSYAAFFYNFKGNDSLLNVEPIELELLESDSEIINLENAFPMSDKEGMKLDETFDFQVTTRTRTVTNVNYALRVEKVSVDSGYTALLDSDIKIYLEDFEGNGLITPTLIGDLHDYVFYQESNSHSDDKGELVDKYKLRLWIDGEVDASDWDQNTKLQYKMKIGVVADEYKYSAPNLNPKGSIPEGAYYANIATMQFYDEMPNVVSPGDAFLYGDYAYLYNSELNGWDVALALEETFEEYGTAEVFASYPKPTKNQTTYGQILESINGVKIARVGGVFWDCQQLEISPVIPSGTVNMIGAFQDCKSLQIPPIIPDGVVNMERTFASSAIVSSPKIPSGVINMKSTFSDCEFLKSAPVIPNTVTDLSHTFDNCISLKTAPQILSDVTNMQYTFYNCISLKTAPKIPSGVTDMTYTFYNCTSLVSPPDMSEVTSLISMHDTFSGCSSLREAPIIPSSVTDMNYTFSDCSSLREAPVIPSGVINMRNTFSGCTSLEIAPVIPNTVTDMDSTFSGCSSLREAPVIPSGVTSLSGTFYDCSSLREAPIIPSGVIQMGNTFAGCTSLEIAPVIPNTVIYMYYTFKGCTALKTAPVIPSSVKTMGHAFEGCKLLTGNVEINANLDSLNYTDCFKDTEKPIKIIGSSGIITKMDLASTANNGNVTY